MQDPDSPVRAAQPVDERDVRSGIARAIPSSFEDEDTHPRLGLGTHEIPIGPAADARPAADLDLAAIPRAILVFDAAGRVVDANPLAETLIGFRRVELVGEPIDLIATRLASIEQLGRIRFVPETAGACVHHRNGRAIPVEVLLCPHQAGLTVAVLRSVETTEAGLREEDVAQIVHDLKNPLSTIALETRLLDDKLAHGVTADTRDTLARITHNIEFLDRMVQDLVDLCSLDAGHLELKRRPTELRTLVSQAIDRVVPTRDRARVSFQAAAPVTASIDDLRIERVVANLLQNALKYAPSVTGIVVELATANDAIRVSVSDAGPGMTSAETGYVFDKFRRGTTASAQDGSGLGLYVSKKIVEAHGGRIDVTSVYGAGSQFYFELPAI